MAWGGAQGNSQGVGYFSKISEKWTEYLCHAVREGLYPEDQRPGAPDPTAYVPRQPAAPHGFLPEVAFRDDRRHFALTGWGLAWLMGIYAVTCAAACGSVQVGKLKVYHLVLRNCRLHYAPGTLPTPLGPLPLQSGGFMLTGVPLVMGKQPGPQIAKAEASLAKIERALYRLRPAYVLVLRIVLAYVVAPVDYVYEAMPPCPTRLRRTQRAVDRVLTRALQVPRNVPRALLWMPVAGGGFGFPRLYSRMRLRHVLGFQGHGLAQRAGPRERPHPPPPRPLEGPGWPGPGAPSPHHGRDPIGGTRPSGGSSTTGGRGRPGVPDVRVRGPPGRGWGDGGHARRRHPGLGHAGGGQRQGPRNRHRRLRVTRAASPWAAEWAGKLEAWHLAETLGVAPAAVQCVGADCTSATLGSDGGVPSQSPWVDKVRVAFAEALGRGRPDPYVPAQHNTQWSGLLSGLQARAHNFAAEGLGLEREGMYPLPGAVGGTAQLFSSHCLVTAVPWELDRLYTQLASPSVTFVRGLPGDDRALLAWAQLLADRGVPMGCLRFAAWVRMAPLTHTSAHTEFHCA